jgi:hypothetical protein
MMLLLEVVVLMSIGGRGMMIEPDCKQSNKETNTLEEAWYIEVP